jgi:hypothetical protein
MTPPAKGNRGKRPGGTGDWGYANWLGSESIWE